MALLPDPIVANVALMTCPACGGDLVIEKESLTCGACGHLFSSEEGIPLLFWPHDRDPDKGDVTEIVKAFYEETPFPNYDDMDSAESLRAKAGRGLFVQALSDQIPRGARVLEVGCGTGQMSNVLSLGGEREVFGADMCLNSLKLGRGFADRNGLDVGFVQMNLFRPVFHKASFDMVICNGVLHHTADPYGGFQSILDLVAPGGHILIGLYNRFGRILTNVRRSVFKVSGGRFTSLDPRIRKGGFGDLKRKTWYLDQYRHPHESQHSIGEVLGWFDRNGVDFCASLPPIDGSSGASAVAGMLQPKEAGSATARLKTQARMIVDDREGGFYMMIGRKRGG